MNLLDWYNKNKFSPISYLEKTPEYRFLLEITSFLDKSYDKVSLAQRMWHVKNDNFSLQICQYCQKSMNYYNGYQVHKECKNNKISDKISKVFKIKKLLSDLSINDYKIGKGNDVILKDSVITFFFLDDLFYEDERIMIKKKEEIESLYNKRNIQIIYENCINDKEKYKEILSYNSNKIIERISARKCEIRNVHVNDAKRLLENNHLQGYVGYTVCYGLYYDNKLIQIMTFKCTNKDEKIYEVGRLCTEKGYMIIGGANKLFSHFKNNVDFSKCITYCDKSMFSGNVYKNLNGFIREKDSSPAYFYISEEKKIISRHFCKLKNLYSLFPQFIGMSEKEIIKKLNFKRVYNCGNYKFVYYR